MNPQRIVLNRWLAASAAAACFVASAVVAVRAPSEALWWGGLLRAGIVLVALWACLPTKDRPAAWADLKPLSVALYLGAALLTMLRPKVGVPMLVLLLIVRYVTTPFRRKAPPRKRAKTPQ